MNTINVKHSTEQYTQQLFQTRPIDEIRRTEHKTRSEIQTKKNELQKLIGNRYRDVMESADSTTAMKQTAFKLKANLCNAVLTSNQLQVPLINTGRFLYCFYGTI